MKKLIIVLLFFNTFMFSQEQFEISVDNFEPRVGQEVRLSFSGNFMTKFFQRELGNDIKYKDSDTDITAIDIVPDGINRTIIFNKSGINTIGPLVLNFDGIKYVSNQLVVNVRPQMKIEEGVWLLSSEFEDEKYVIIEQIVRNVKIEKVDESGILNTSFDIPEKFVLATLKENLGDDIGLAISDSKTEQQFPENTDFEYGITYSKTRYRVVFGDSFKGEYTLSKKDVIDLPRKNKLEDKIILKK